MIKTYETRASPGPPFWDPKIDSKCGFNINQTHKQGGGGFRPENAPKWSHHGSPPGPHDGPQKGPKMNPKWSQNGPQNGCIIGYYSVLFNIIQY